MQVQSKSRLNRKTVALLLAAAVSAGISSAVYGQTTYSGPAFEGAQIETGSAYVSSSGAFFTLEGAGYQYANFGILDFSPAALGIPAGNNVTSISSLNVQLTQEDYFNPPTTSPGATLTFYLASDTNATEVANGSTSLSYENPSTYTGGLNAPGQTGSFVAGSSLIELGTSTYTNGAPNGTVDLVNLPVTSAVNSALLAQFNTGQPIRIVVTTSETSSDGDAFYGYNYATNPAYDPKISLGLNTSSVASNGSLLYANTIGSKSASVTVGTYLTDHGAGQYCVLQGATSNEVITTNPNGTQNIAPSTVTLVNGSSAPGDTLSYVVQSTNNATGTITTPGPNPMAPGGTAQATVGFGPADSTTEAGNQISGSATFSNSSNYKNDTTGVTVNINPALVLQERFVDSFGGSSNNPTLAPNAHKVLVGATGTVAASITTDNPVNITDYSNDALTTETLLPNQTSTPAKVTDFFTFATVATITASSPSYSQTFDNTQVGTVTGMVVPIISGQYGNDVPVTEGTLTQKYTPTYTAFPQAAITGDGLQGEKDSSEIFVQWTGYQAAAVTSASGSPIGPSPSTPAVLSNAPSDDNNYVDTNGTTHINGLRATAWVTGIAFNQDGWSQTGFTPSSNGSGTTVAVAAGSSTAGTASATLAFNSTNKLNGTYSGTMAVALENEQDIQGTSVNDVAPVTFNLQTIVTSQPAIESGSYTLIGGKFVAAATNLTGTLALTSGLASFPSGLAISGSGKVVLATNATLGSQSTPPASSVNITSLSITGNGTLDINNNHIIISYAVGQDPIASIAALIKSGFNGGAWNGLGITSAAAAANSGSYGIGYADSADLDNPAGLSSGQIEIMYTLLGDANLDGAVNGSDFAILASNFNKAVGGWDQGDFNYDGAANGSDFASLASNFNKGASQSADASLVSFASTNGLLADVPEPASMGLLAVSGLSLLARRKRRVNG